MPKRSKSSARWLAEHAADPYVKRAHDEGWRSRAAFKLEEIQKSDRLLKPGMTVVDLGAAPGGWSQYAARRLDGKGRVIALDVLEMPAIPGVEFIQGDFGEDAVLERLQALLAGDQADLVMSDITRSTFSPPSAASSLASTASSVKSSWMNSTPGTAGISSTSRAITRPLPARTRAAYWLHPPGAAPRSTTVMPGRSR